MNRAGAPQCNVLSTPEDIMAKKSVKKTVKKKTAVKETVVRQQWEYETYSISLENDVPDFHKKLDGLGEKGWELVGVLPKEHSELLIFKRPRGWE
jgi:hypothetical protein